VESDILVRLFQKGPGNAPLDDDTCRVGFLVDLVCYRDPEGTRVVQLSYPGIVADRRRAVE
jgi:hypothetical protein